MTSQRKIKDGILYSTKNSFYDFASVEADPKKKDMVSKVKESTAKPTQQSLKDFSSIEQTIQIDVVDLTVQQVAKKEDKKVSLKDLIDDE
jgi:hypothetical protein